MAEPEGHRVGSGMYAEFVHEALVRKCVLNAQRRTQRAGEERRADCAGQNAFAADGSSTRAVSLNACGHVRGDGVAAVAQPSLRRLRTAGLPRPGFVATP